MAARAIWKGIIRFGGISVPVKLYSAVEDRNIHFRLLHEKDHTPVEQRMVNPATGEAVPGDQVRRGVETGEGEIVILTPDELESLEPDASRDIEILRFVDPERISHQWYDRPYYMGPDGDPAPYFALVKALEKERKEGVARWKMRKKSYVGALGIDNGYLTIITLRHAGEVVDAASLPRPSSRDLEPQELRMAEQLVSALEAEFDPAAYRDEYRDQVMALIETKAQGGTIRMAKVREPRPKAASLTDMLERSLKQAKEENKRAGSTR